MDVGEGSGRLGVDVHLRDLRAFVTVAEHLHFSRAADALYVSQPALSKQIRALERLLGEPLFVRDRRTVQLTGAGEAILTGARAALSAWSDAQHALDALAASARSAITIGISLGVERGLLPALRSRLADLAPDMTLRLKRVSWTDQTSGLAQEPGVGTDAALVWLPLPDPERYQWISVASEPCWLLMSNRHALAGRDEVAFDAIVDEPFLALPGSAGLARDFWLATDARTQPARIAGVASSTEELIEALRMGTGVCLIAEGNLEAFRRKDIAMARVVGLRASELVFAWRRDDNRKSLRAVIAALSRSLADLDSGTQT